MDSLSILILIFLVFIIISTLLIVGFFKLSKLPFKFPHLFSSSSYSKETIALNDQLKTKIKSIKFQILNKGNKESQLTRMHAKLRKSNNVNQLNVFASDTQKIIDEKFDDYTDFNESELDYKMHDSLKSTSLSFAFTSSTSSSDFYSNIILKEKNKSNKILNNLINNNFNNVNYNTTAINMDNISIPNSIQTCTSETINNSENLDISLGSKN